MTTEIAITIAIGIVAAYAVFFKPRLFAAMFIVVTIAAIVKALYRAGYFMVALTAIMRASFIPCAHGV